MRAGPTLRIVADAAELTREALALVLETADSAVRERGVFRIALSGGSTPRALYEALAQTDAAHAAFERWEVFFGDERWVPAEHRDSNLRLAREALLAHVAIPPRQVHPIPTEQSTPADAAQSYARTLRARFGIGPGELPRFDLALLGMGADGHTASLFPGGRAVETRGELAVAERVAALGAERVTLTLEVFGAARRVLFLVAGADKARALREVLEPPAERGAAALLPAARVDVSSGELIWLVDRAAAALLARRPQRGAP